MDAPKYKEWILETIDQLRKRKARPDKERICHMVERKHGISFDETESDLEKLVDAEVVIKVDYKGSTSYRNAAKWRKSHLGGSVLNSNDASRKLEAAMKALLTDATTEDPKGPSKGVSFEEIEKWLLEQDEDSGLTKDALQVAFGREVEAERITKLDNGNYVLSLPKDDSPSPDKTSPTKPKSGQVSAPGSPVKKARPANATNQNNNKRKRVKKSHGEDFRNLDDYEDCPDTPAKKERKDKSKEQTPEKSLTSIKSKSADGTKSGERSKSVERSKSSDKPKGSEKTKSSTPKSSYHDKGLKGAEKVRDILRQSLGEMSPAKEEVTSMEVDEEEMVGRLEEKCDYCLQTKDCNRRGEPEDLLVCKDCAAKAHPSCMDYSEELAKRALNSPWQCIDCKTCCICDDAGDPDAMLFCDACDKGYHMNCHNPAVEDKPKGKWVCQGCVLELGPLPESPERQASRTNGQTDGGGASCLPTPNDSPVHFSDESSSNHVGGAAAENHTPITNGPTRTVNRPNGMYSRMNSTPIVLPRLADTLPKEIPDASDWSIEDVVKFFKSVGFIEQSEVFREQEIDGKSLLLMKRSDVLTGLSLKLGPALKIYTHVQRLQTRGMSMY